ncbi:MinD/ParA family protein [Terrilactibacillus sp. S3-3]|nr:MinD/ParA family protein [Terrilactibacillus sp. S3-3]
MDLDIGMGNIEQLMGIPSSRHIVDMLTDHFSIWEAVVSGPENVSFISGGNGFLELFRLDERHIARFLQQIGQFKNSYDFIIFDFGAGLSDEALQFVLAVSEIILLTTPEPTAMADAYSALKMIHAGNPDLPFSCVINQADSVKEGKETWKRLADVARHFQGVDLRWLCALHREAVIQSVKAQKPYLLLHPKAKISLEMRLLARTFIARQGFKSPEASFTRFLSQLKKKWVKPMGGSKR